MDEEAGFLSAIRQAPTDETARLVYADWLDERGGSASAAKSAFLRLEIQLAYAPDDSPDRLDGPERLRRLASTLDRLWLELLARVPLEGCSRRLIVPCPGRWELLVVTGTPTVRFCDVCERTVRYCDTPDAANSIPRAGGCVAISPAAVRRDGDIPPPRLFGVPAYANVLQARPRRSYGCRVPESLPPPEPESEAGRPDAAPSRRQKNRGRHRNLQRDDWEDAE